MFSKHLNQIEKRQEKQNNMSTKMLKFNSKLDDLFFSNWIHSSLSIAIKSKYCPLMCVFNLFVCKNLKLLKRRLGELNLSACRSMVSFI